MTPGRSIMEPFFWRTGATDLTDGELLILDFLFDLNRVPYRALRNEAFAFHHNCVAGHGMDDDALWDVLDRRVADGTLRLTLEEIDRDDAEPGDERGDVPDPAGGPPLHRYYALTPAGGRLWEAERLPDWDRYCSYMEESDPDREPPGIMSAFAPDKEIARALLEACAAMNDDHRPDWAALTSREWHDLRFDLEGDERDEAPSPWLPLWRPFPLLYQLDVPFNDGDLNGERECSSVKWPDFAEYERRRRQFGWWCNYKEIMALHKPG